MSRFVLTAQLQLQAPKNVGQVVNQIQRQLNGINVNVNVKGAAQAQSQVNKLAKSTNQASTAAEKMGRSFGNAIKRFSAMAIATRAVSLFTNTLADAVRESISFERQLIKISQVTGKTISQLGSLTNTISNLSTTLGTSSSSLLDVSRILSQAGLSARETEVALSTLARTDLAPTFDNITQTAEGAVAIFNQFRKGAAALESQLGSINAVAGQFAVEAGDLISVVRRTGGVFKAAGGELNELIALFTSVRATTRESAESIATGLRTIFTRIQRPKTIEYLKKYGVELTDLEGKFVGPYEAVRRLSGALAGLEEGDITFVQIAEELGGFRQIGKVIPLLQQFNVAQQALNVAQEGSSSLAKDAATAQLALAVQVTKVKEQFLELVRGITATPTFQIMAKTALTLASALIKVADSLKPILPIITAIAAVKFTKGIGGFLGGIAGGLKGGKGFNAGGVVRGFARGGVVPGTGNRDTVPAMLTPGEFVIKKSSVQKLGAGTLAQMNENRYANGTTGTGARNKQGMTPEQVALAAERKRLRQKQGMESSKGSLGNFGLAAMYGTSDAGFVPTPLPNSEYSVNTKFGVLDKKISNTYETKMKASVRKISTDFAQTLAGDLKDTTPIKGAALNQLIDKAGFANAVGAFFETALALTGAPYEQKSAINDSIDFVGGLGGAAKNFGLSPTIMTDATRTAGSGGKGRSKFAAQIKRFLAKDPSKRSLPGFDTSQKSLARFATGGPVGTDTVPALLTPGEFVVNKASAQRIGYGSLNRMNKVGKYAKGGTVQRFAGGGQAQGGGGLLGFGGLTEGLVGAQMALGMLTPTIDENSSAFERGAASFLTSINTIVGMATLVTTSLAAFNIQLKAQDVGKLLKSMFTKGSGGIGEIVKNAIGGANQDIKKFSTDYTGRQNQLSSINKKMQNVRDAAPEKNFVDPYNAVQRKRRADSLRQLRSQKANLTPKSLSGKFGNFLGRQAAGGGIKGRIAGLAARGAGAVTSGGVAGAAGAAASLVGPFTAAAGAVKIFGGLMDDISGRTIALNKAIEEGNVAEAEKVAYNKAGAEAVTNLSAGISGALAVIPGFGPAIGALIGGTVKVLSELPIIGDRIKGFAGAVSVAFGGKTLDSIVAMAGAQAAASKATKDMVKAQKAATVSMDEFARGNITAAEALAQIEASTASTDVAEQKAIKSVQENSKNKGGLRRDIGAYLTLGYMDSSAERNSKIDKENKAAIQGSMKLDQERFDMTKGARMATARAMLSSGKSLEEVEQQAGAGQLRDKQSKLLVQAQEMDVAGDEEGAKLVREAAEQAGAQAAELERSFKNLADEVKKQKAYIASMNLGLNAASGAAGAASTALSNYMASQELGASTLSASAATVSAAMTKAAIGISTADFDKSMKEVGATLKKYGASDADVTRVTTSMKANYLAQKNSEKALKNFKKKLSDDSATGLGGKGKEAQIQGLFDEIIKSAGLGNSDAGKQLRAKLDGLSDELDWDEINAEDFSSVQEVLEKVGVEQAKQYEDIIKAEQAYHKAVIDITNKRNAAEDALIKGLQSRADRTLEAMEIKASAGGPAVTAADRSRLNMEKANATTKGIGGITALRTGSPAELLNRAKELKVKQQQLGAERNRSAFLGEPIRGGGEAGMAFGQEEKRVNQASAELYSTVKQEIAIRQQEIKTIQEKNKLEKQGMESLLAGDIEGFFDAQTTQGAMGAIAAGNTADFSGDDLYKAYQEIKRQADAGVTEINGQQIQGAGGLLERAAAATAEARGLDPAQAAMVARGATGASPEEQKLNNEIQQLANILPMTADLEIQAADLQMQAAELQLAAAGGERDSATKEAETSKGRARGGLIYAAKGRLINFVPKGTDTVPAMLTPGEFVVNRAAVQRGNNLQLLKAMNQGARTAAAASPAAMSRGGVVYREKGSTNPESSSGGGSSISMDSGAMEKFANALNKFSDQIKETISTLQATKFQVQLDSTSVNVNVSGSSFLENLSKEINDEVIDSITSELRKYKVTENGRLTKSSSEVD